MIFDDLKDKKIILTGGSRGIGLSMLDRFYSLGSKVLIIGSNKENLEKTKQKYPGIFSEAFDLNNHSEISDLFKKCVFCNNEKVYLLNPDLIKFGFLLNQKK